MPFEGRHPDLNPNPRQFNVSTLTASEIGKLQELQHLDMLQELADPEPDDHIWKCLAVTNHKVRELDEDDIHVKVKALWPDGEQTWIRLDALRIQDPYPLVTYAVKRKLTK
jgi:hypothetical protein